MIVELLLNLVYKIFEISWLDIPPLPPEIYSYLEVASDWISVGAGILANYVPLDYIMVLFGFIVTVDIAINIYHFVLWVLKKIPLFGIE